MPAVRGVNLRSGDLNEEYGFFLLRLIGALAPVPRTEDVGVDAFVTLLQRDGPLYRAAETILVQLKSDSVTHIFFDADDKGKRKGTGETEWLRSMEFPFFFGSVSRVQDGKPGRMRLYVSHALYRALFNDPQINGIGICFNETDARESHPTADEVSIVYLGPPVVELDLVELNDDRIRGERIEVLQEWARVLRRILRIGPTGMMLNCKWQPNQLPEGQRCSVGLRHLNTADGIKRANREAAMGLMPLLAERLMQGTEKDIDDILRVLKSLENRGVDILVEHDAIDAWRDNLQPLRHKRQTEIGRGGPEAI